ncbi:MAG TPA: hypothetical protein HPP66_07390 [Planctomycetes bacterium]|nr:hypothetical protein [Planctomycetota bacterium]
MKKEGILLTVVVLLIVTGVAQAQVGELHGAVEFAFQSKYIWRGFDPYGDKSAIQPSIDLDLFDTGFGLNVMAHRANSSGYENGERWDYTLYYGNKLFEDELYATNWRMGYVYYNYPDMTSHTEDSADLQELHWVFSWPNVIPVEGLVPTYVLVKLWPSNSGSLANEASGFAHIFMLDYGLKLPGILPDTDEQILRLHTELIYNDGVDPRPGSAGVDHDWSNIVFGIATDFDLGNNVTFTPGLYHQITMDDSVNDDQDETWVSLSLKYNF